MYLKILSKNLKLEAPIDQETGNREGKRAHDIAARDPHAGKSRSKAEAAIAGLPPWVGGGAVDDGGAIAIDDGGALQEAYGGEGNVVGGAPDRALHQVLLPARSHFRSSWISILSVGRRRADRAPFWDVDFWTVLIETEAVRLLSFWKKKK